MSRSHLIEFIVFADICVKEVKPLSSVMVLNISSRIKIFILNPEYPQISLYA